MTKRNYFQIEKTDDGIFLCEGKGTPTPVDYDESEHWNDWEHMESDEVLFGRIKKLLAAQSCIYYKMARIAYKHERWKKGEGNEYD